MMLLQGKRALITGGTSGIGRAIAAAFVHAGARVVIAGRDQARGEAVARELGNATFIKADVSSLADVRRLARRRRRTACRRAPTPSRRLSSMSAKARVDAADSRG
jgi:NAD(P)-dependent dehydrogenase (short-subunit alcohol dehydrogenase family)